MANPYNRPSRSQATFNDDANETWMFSSADENPWDGYDSALDDKLALEEESISEDEAGVLEESARSKTRPAFVR